MLLSQCKSVVQTFPQYFEIYWEDGHFYTYREDSMVPDTIVYDYVCGRVHQVVPSLKMEYDQEEDTWSGTYTNSEGRSTYCCSFFPTTVLLFALESV